MEDKKTPAGPQAGTYQDHPYTWLAFEHIVASFIGVNGVCWFVRGECPVKTKNICMWHVNLFSGHVNQQKKNHAADKQTKKKNKLNWLNPTRAWARPM